MYNRNMSYVNRDPRNQDHTFDRPLATSPPARAQVQSFGQNIPSEKVWPEEHLRDKSMAAIKEFYRYLMQAIDVQAFII